MSSSPPRIRITEIVAVDHLITVIYDLHSQRACRVEMRASLDDGDTFIDGPLDHSGAIGEKVLPGTGHAITWDHSGTIGDGVITIEVIADDGHVPDINAMVRQVDEQRLMELLRRISIPRHHISAPGGLREVRDLIHDHFQQHGLRTSLQTVEYGGSIGENVVGRLVGSFEPGTSYIVDGHYDAVAGSPGADDNGSAVAAMLEVVRIVSQYQFKNSLRFLGFAFEEQGHVGSSRYVENGIPAWEKVQGVLNLEMIGYRSLEPGSQTMPPGFHLLFPDVAAHLEMNGHTGDFLTVVGNMNSSDLANTFMGAMERHVPQLKGLRLIVPENGRSTPDLRRSDHAPFWDAGIPALMLTDGSNYRNPNYHLPADTVETIDPTFLMDCTKAVLATAATLAMPVNAGTDRWTIDGRTRERSS